jgi:hypothetical protein
LLGAFWDGIERTDSLLRAPTSFRSLRTPAVGRAMLLLERTA